MFYRDNLIFRKKKIPEQICAKSIFNNKIIFLNHFLLMIALHDIEERGEISCHSKTIYIHFQSMVFIIIRLHSSKKHKCNQKVAYENGLRQD